jgi:hypothetical protein
VIKLFSHRSSVALATAALFAFFLAASAPHRVHHFFEENYFPPESVGHSDSEHHHEHPHKHAPEPEPIKCPVYSVAQHSQVSIVQSFEITLVQTLIAGCVNRPVVRLSSNRPSPISQRAPPKA